MGQSFWLKSQSGNYSGDTFDPTKKYVGVRLQQDVELLDRDWNELEDIRRYEEVILRKWYIGNGTPNDGFKISQVEDPRDFNISPGRCQVDGFEAVNDTGISYSDQNDPETQNSLPDLTIPQGERSDTVYLDISIREISGLEDPDLMNPQDLTHETCRRHKIEWLVRVDEGRGVGSTEPFNKEDFHYYYDIARIDREDAQISISDLRRTKLAVYLLKDSLDALGDLSASLNDLKGSANNLKILVDGLQSSQDVLKSSQNNLENTVNDLNVSVNSLKVAQNDSSNSINALKRSQNVLTDILTTGKIADGLHGHSKLVRSKALIIDSFGSILSEELPGDVPDQDPALIIDSFGSISIGKPSPVTNARLDIQGGGLNVGGEGALDATIHVKSSYGGFDRLLQMSPWGPLKPGLNLLASTNNRGDDQWWVWGVDTDNRWKIQPGTGFSEATGFFIDSSGNVGIGTIGPRNAALGIRGKGIAEELVSFEDPNGRTKWHINQNLGGNNPGLNFVQTGVADGRLFLKADGNVGIGTVNPGTKLDVAGVVRAASFIPPSDVRFKTDIVPLEDVLSKLEKIRGVSFQWNNLDPFGRAGKGREIGLIAQEVEAVFPELVVTWGNQNCKGIDYDRFAGVLVEAIKQLKAEKEASDERIKTMEDAMAKIEK